MYSKDYSKKSHYINIQTKSITLLHCICNNTTKVVNDVKWCECGQYNSDESSLKDMSMTSRILKDTSYSPWPWPWSCDSCPIIYSSIYTHFIYF